MVKGVNKSIIEINDTGSEYFEKIVFYVAPKYGKLGIKQLLSETDKFNFKYDKKHKKKSVSLRKKMLRRKRILLLSCFISAAAFITTVVFLIVR